VLKPPGADNTEGATGADTAAGAGAPGAEYRWGTPIGAAIEGATGAEAVKSRPGPIIPKKSSGADNTEGAAGAGRRRG